MASLLTEGTVHVAYSSRRTSVCHHPGREVAAGNYGCWGSQLRTHALNLMQESERVRCHDILSSARLPSNASQTIESELTKFPSTYLNT